MDLTWLNSEALPCQQPSSSHSKSLSVLLILVSSILCPAQVSVLSCRSCCLFSLWELPYLSAPAQQCSIVHWKSGCLSSGAQSSCGSGCVPEPGQLQEKWCLLTHSASNEAHAIEIKLSNMTRLSWILKRITTRLIPTDRTILRQNVWSETQRCESSPDNN